MEPAEDEYPDEVWLLAPWAGHGESYSFDKAQMALETSLTPHEMYQNMIWLLQLKKREEQKARSDSVK